jgi:hypothetical protein
MDSPEGIRVKTKTLQIWLRMTRIKQKNRRQIWQFSFPTKLTFHTKEESFTPCASSVRKKMLHPLPQKFDN